MSTIPHDLTDDTVPPMALSTALAMAECQALDHFGVEYHERISCAMALIKAGKVFQRDDGSWDVGSGTI